MENKYTEHLKCPECKFLKLIEDYEIMRVFSDRVVIQFKCFNCNHTEFKVFVRKNHIDYFK